MLRFVRGGLVFVVVVVGATACFRPVPQAGADSQEPDASSDVDAGSVWVQCASGAVPVDGGPGLQAFHVWVTQVPTFDMDAGGVVDGGFRLRAWASELHPAGGIASTAPAEVEGSGGLGVYADLSRLGFVSVEFGQGDRLVAYESYLPDFLIGTLSLAGAQASVWCWMPGHVLSSRYQAADGTCRDSAGKVSQGGGYRPFFYVRETGDGECASLYSDLTEGDPSNPTLMGWNLQGADFSQSVLHSANLESAQLQGANLANFDFSNARVSGEVDGFTRLPSQCSVVGTDATCQR